MSDFFKKRKKKVSLTGTLAMSLGTPNACMPFHDQGLLFRVHDLYSVTKRSLGEGLRFSCGMLNSNHFWKTGGTCQFTIWQTTWNFTLPLAMPMSCLHNMLALFPLAKLVCLTTTWVVILVIVLILVAMLIEDNDMLTNISFPVFTWLAVVSCL